MAEITWLTYHALEHGRDGWSSDMASVRYRLLIPAQELRKYGHGIHVVHLAPGWRAKEILSHIAGELVVVSKPYFPETKLLGEVLAQTRGLVESVQASGRKVVADVCDDYFSHSDYGGYFRALVEMADLVVSSTQNLAAAVRNHTLRPVVVVPDPYEGKRGVVEFQPPKTRSNGFIAGLLRGSLGADSPRPLRLLWFGHGSNLGSLLDLLPDLKGLAASYRLHLCVVSVDDAAVKRYFDDLNAEYAPAFSVQYSPWSLDVTWQALRACDLVIIPIQADDPTKLAKSANRLIEAIQAGRFVVANPIPTYQEFVEFAWLGESIVDGVRWAVGHPAEVRRRVAAGQGYVAAHYAPEVIGKEWDAALGTVMPGTAPMTALRPLRLNLGCGGQILPGYVNVDVAEVRNDAKPDLVCDVRQLSRHFPENSADEVLSVHVVEHFWRWEVADILREWVRVMKPGGKMILECPNIANACRELLENPESVATPGVEGAHTMWVLYGDPAWRDPLMVHRWGYTPHSLGQLMAEVGLVNIRQEPAQFKLREPRDMRLVGEKACV